MREFICAANWKLNKTPSEAKGFCQEFTELAQGLLSEGLQCVLFPSACHWRDVAEVFEEQDFQWGPQNCYIQNSGAFTGENSAQVAQNMGASYVLVGHSERRQFFSEGNDLLANKVQAFQSLGLIPVLCTGETLEERQSSKTREVIEQQLKRCLSKVDFSKKLVVAYEPVWAIGTGKVASVEQVEETHRNIREILVEMAGREIAESLSILYGGSVKGNNAQNLGKLSHVDGFLIGGASLKVESFLEILKISSNL